MNTRLALSTAVCAAMFATAALATNDATDVPLLIGFGSGTGMGTGASTGNASSLTDSFSSPSWSSGSGSQSFGGGFDPSQTPGSGSLSSNPSAPTGSGPVLTRPH